MSIDQTAEKVSRSKEASARLQGSKAFSPGAKNPFRRFINKPHSLISNAVPKPEHRNWKSCRYKSQSARLSFAFVFLYQCCDSFRFEEHGPSEHCQRSPKCTVPSPRWCGAHASRSLSPGFPANFGCVAGSSFNPFSAPLDSFRFRFLSLSSRSPIWFSLNDYIIMLFVDAIFFLRCLIWRLPLVLELCTSLRELSSCVFFVNVSISVSSGFQGHLGLFFFFWIVWAL